MKSLKIENLHVVRGSEEIVKGVDIEVRPGELHALMGPNGSGKSTLANALMGHPKYEIADGRIITDGEDITALPANERARRGLFLSMQYPPEIHGVSVSSFLRTARDTVRGEKTPVMDFHTQLKEKMAALGIDATFGRRALNVGFSGGEKKRVEMLQMLTLEPKYAVLDETDSGLDVDALSVVTDAIEKMREEGTGVLLITHYARILEKLVPDRVHVMKDGKLAATGGPELAGKIEQEGFEAV